MIRWKSEVQIGLANITVRNGTIINFRYGVSCDGPACQVQRVRFVGNPVGVIFGGVDGLIEKCTITGFLASSAYQFSSIGILLSLNSRARVQENQVSGYSQGIAVDTNSIVTDNSVRHCDTGIVSPSITNKLMHNDIIDCQVATQVSGLRDK